MIRGFIVIVGLLFSLSACTQRLACPAYQSSFIYDKETLRQKFSYFNEDSTPKILTASKSKYLIAVPESYRKKYRRLLTVEMKPVYPRELDSLKKAQDQGMELAEQDSASMAAAQDTTKVEPGDSTYAITKTKEKFNLDQDLYMWYFREMLVLPDVRAALEDKSEKGKEKGEGKSGTKEKVGFFNKLKNLFKKKPKNDSTAVSSPPLKVNASDPPATPPEESKKGGLFKKKNKVGEPEKKKDPAKKEGDGF